MLPSDPAARKRIPIWSGCIKYFPKSLAAIAQLSFIANEQHNPGTPVHWDKSKSQDELDALMRHLDEIAQGIEYDTDGILQDVKVAWRAVANLERQLDAGVAVMRPAPDAKCVTTADGGCIGNGCMHDPGAIIPIAAPRMWGRMPYALCGRCGAEFAYPGDERGHLCAGPRC